MIPELLGEKVKEIKKIKVVPLGHSVPEEQFCRRVLADSETEAREPVVRPGTHSPLPLFPRLMAGCALR